MFKLSRRNLLAFALVLAVFAVVLALTPTASDVNAASNCTYYSNSSYSTVVGQFGRDCCNNPVAWGKKTKWVICGGCFSCTPPPR